MPRQYTPQVDCSCQICGTAFKTRPSRVANGRGKYCSKLCYYEAMRRKPQEIHPRWKGGVRVPTDSGYRMERVGTGYKREHRRIMEEHLGRPLRDDEEVHHVNGDRADNRLENLRVMTEFEHKSLHARLRGGVRGRKSV